MNTFISRLAAGLGLLLFFVAAAVWAQSQTATTPNLALSNVLNSDGTVSLKVQITGTDGTIQSVGGGTQYAEDGVSADGETGNVMLGTRRDVTASSTATNGDRASSGFSPEGGLYVASVATVGGGASSLKRNSVGTTEDEHEVKASAGTLYSITTTNTNAAVRFLRCANQVAASTTPGTTTPIIDLAIPGATTGGGFANTFPVGLAFSTGLTCWFVTGAADTDVAEVAANEVKALYTFK